MSAGGGARRAAALAAIPAAVLALYWPAAIALGEVWSDSARTTYTHGWLIAAISGWLLWRSRARALLPDTHELSTGVRVAAFVALTASVHGNSLFAPASRSAWCCCCCRCCGCHCC